MSSPTIEATEYTLRALCIDVINVSAAIIIATAALVCVGLIVIVAQENIGKWYEQWRRRSWKGDGK